MMRECDLLRSDTMTMITMSTITMRPSTAATAPMMAGNGRVLSLEAPGMTVGLGLLLRPVDGGCTVDGLGLPGDICRAPAGALQISTLH